MGVLERKGGIVERSWRTLVWLCLLLAATTCVAADSVSPIEGAWREARPGDTPAQVLAEAKAGQLHAFDPARMQVFPTNDAGAWVVLRAAPPWIAEDRVLSIHTPSLGRVSLYDDKGKVQSAALEDFEAPFHGHGRLIFPLKAERSPAAPILLKFEPSPTLSGPVTFGLQNWPEFLRDDARWLVFATTCLAVMLAMAAMSICFALMLRDMTFAWYTGYLVCYALIQGIQTGYLFHPMEWASLSSFASGLGAAAVAVSVSFAALFLIRFADLSRYAPLLRTPVMALAIGMPLIVLLRISGIDVLAHTAQTLLNPILILGALLVHRSHPVCRLRRLTPRLVLPGRLDATTGLDRAMQRTDERRPCQCPMATRHGARRRRFRGDRALGRPGRSRADDPSRPRPCPGPRR